jgi:hypothetical protein
MYINADPAEALFPREHGGLARVPGGLMLSC